MAHIQFVERATRESPFGGTIAHGFLVLSLIPPQEDRQWPALLIFGGALIGVMLQWYLFYIEVAVLQAICYWCVTSQAIITVIFLLAFPRRDPDVEEMEADRVAE